MMRAALLVAALLLSSPASAFTGNDLYRECKGDDAGLLYCTGYISGASEMLAIWMQVGGGRPICIYAEHGVNLGQIRDVVVKYLYQPH
jgi:hypothetical protein